MSARQKITLTAACEAKTNGWTAAETLGAGHYDERLARIYGRDEDGDLAMTAAQETRLINDITKEMA